jgi:hypothetical protein
MRLRRRNGASYRRNTSRQRYFSLYPLSAAPSGSINDEILEPSDGTYYARIRISPAKYHSQSLSAGEMFQIVKPEKSVASREEYLR